MLRWLKRGLGSIATLALVFGLAFLAGRGGVGGDRWLTPQAVTVAAYPVDAFRIGLPELRRFGPLEFIGGIELRGNHVNFGGISGLRMRLDGERFIAVTDAGDWIAGRIIYRAGAPAGLADVTIAPVLLASGHRAKDAGLWDAESLTLDGDEAFIGVERDHAVLRFDMATDAVRARGKRIPVPALAQHWPENRGLEAIGIVPPASPFGGRILGLSERSGGRDEPIAR